MVRQAAAGVASGRAAECEGRACECVGQLMAPAARVVATAVAGDRADVMVGVKDAVSIAVNV